MKKVVIVCKDCEYVSLIEYRLAEVFEKKAEIEILTQEACIKEYFLQPRNIDLLIIEQDLYEGHIDKQNIEQIFVISEDANKKNYEKGNFHIILKYESIRILLEKIKQYFSVDQNEYMATTKVVNIYAVSEAYKKTTTAMGIAYRLAKEGNKVIYINTESLQDFGYYLNEKTYLKDDTGIEIALEPERAVENILNQKIKNVFDYIPPLKKVLESYNIKINSYDVIIERIKKKNIYDYIIVDLPCNIQRETLALLCKGEKIVLLTEQTVFATYKLEKFLTCTTNIEGKCVLVVKNYDKNEQDILSTTDIIKTYPVGEYIENETDSYETGYSMGQYKKIVKTLE